MKSYEDNLKVVEHQIQRLAVGSVFFLKEVYPDWILLPKGDKLRMGKAFKRAVLLGEIENVVFIGKADNNSSMYERTK